MKIKHDSYIDIQKTIDLLKKAERGIASMPFVVMEFTGHYYKILFRSFYKHGFEVSIINPSNLILSKISV